MFNLYSPFPQAGSPSLLIVMRPLLLVCFCMSFVLAGAMVIAVPLLFGRRDSLECHTASILFAACLILAGTVPLNAVPLLFFEPLLFFWPARSPDCRAANFQQASAIPNCCAAISQEAGAIPDCHATISQEAGAIPNCHV
jgi:hypothetical protein